MVLSRRVEALRNNEPNVLSSSLPQDGKDDLRQLLDSNGVTPAAKLKDATIHIITNLHRFKVRERWMLWYMLLRFVLHVFERSGRCLTCL